MLAGALFGLAAASIWGGMYVVSDVVLEQIPPFTLLTLRLALALVVLAVFARRRGALRPLRREQVGALLGAGMVGLGVSVGSQFVGTDKSTAVNGALITSASPAFILIFAALILHERLTPQRISAVVLATIGVAAIINPVQANFGAETFTGDVILAAAAVTWGLYSVLVRKISMVWQSGAPSDTLVVTLLASAGGLMLAIPAAGVELSQRAVGEIDAGIVLGVLYLGIISTAVALWLWNRAFALVDAATASLFFFAQPVVGALLGVLLLDQPFTTNLLFGSILIAVGVMLAVYPAERLARIRQARIRARARGDEAGP